MANLKLKLFGALFAVTVLFGGTAQAQLYETTATSNLTVSAQADLDDYWVVKVATTLQTADDGYWALPAFAGWLWRVVTNPGAVAPTDNWDMYILDDQGADLLNGGGLNRDTSNTENTFPKTGTDQWDPVYVSGPTYLSIIGNSQDGALVETFLWLRKKAP